MTHFVNCGRFKRFPSLNQMPLASDTEYIVRDEDFVAEPYQADGRNRNACVEIEFRFFEFCPKHRASIQLCVRKVRSPQIGIKQGRKLEVAEAKIGATQYRAVKTTSVKDTFLECYPFKDCTVQIFVRTLITNWRAGVVDVNRLPVVIEFEPCFMVFNQFC